MSGHVNSGHAKPEMQGLNRRLGAWPFVALILAVLLNLGALVTMNSSVVYAGEEITSVQSRDRRSTREREDVIDKSSSGFRSTGSSSSSSHGKSSETKSKTKVRTVRTRASQR